MVYIYMVFSLGQLVINGGKPENPDSFRKNPDNFGRDLSNDCFFSESLNNKL